MLLDELNKAQREAVEYLDGPQLVIAGAGSGKTRVLTYKIAFLLQHGMNPWNVLALTFTNKAAREMKERIAKLVGEERSAGLMMGTFHSVFARILRREATLLGYNDHFTIYDADDSKSLIKVIVKEMQLDEKQYVQKDVAAQISRYKERLLTPDLVRNDRLSLEECQRLRVQQLPAIYERYQQRLRQSNVMDFDDLLLNTFLLFRDNEPVRQRYISRFQYVLVDEYQDTNYAQHVIVRQLSADHGRLCVVGDDAQSIYSFRGANIDNILHLEQYFPGLRVFKLEQNYRSTQCIVNAANSVIAKNQRQYKKNVYSQKQEGEPLQILSCYSDLEEADTVVRRITALKAHYEYSDMSILYRTNFQSRTFEEALRKAHLPYHIYGGLSFYQRKEVKDVIAYCRIAVNPNDEEALRRIINYPTRGIGDTTLSRLSAAAETEQCSLWQVLCDMPQSLEVSAGARRKLTDFSELVNSYVEMAKTANADELMKHIIFSSGIKKELWGSSDSDDISRQENVDELYNGCTDFVAMRVEEGEQALMQYYLQEVSLLTDLDEGDKNDTNRVTLMTIHASKGLEFPVVFVVGMEDEIFPGDKALSSPRAMEEERRLFYVAITRAGDLCYLTNAKMRRKYGQTNFETPSRFLHDIDKRWIKGGQREYGGCTQHRPIKKLESSYVPTSQIKPTSTENQQKFTIGMNVLHSKFGKGVVVNIVGSGLDQKLTVDFGTFGSKQLLSRFARLTIL